MITWRQEGERVVFSGEFGMSEAEKLHGIMLEAVKTARKLILDLGQVDAIDTASVQILAAMAKQGRIKGLVVTPEVTRALTTLGLGGLFKPFLAGEAQA